MSYLCLFTYSGVQHILHCVLVCLSYVPYVPIFSGMFIHDCPFGILQRLFNACFEEYLGYNFPRINSMFDWVNVNQIYLCMWGCYGDNNQQMNEMC